MSGTLLYSIMALSGYACGSIPFGLLLTRFFGKTDVRKIGSGNIGATNVLRTGSKKLAIATLLLDGLKGTLPVLLASHFWSIEAAIFAGLGAFLGHLFPIWLRFKGGKGVATYLGILFGIFWPGALAFIGSWLLVAFISRISSLSALIAAWVPPNIALLMGQDSLSLFLFSLSGLIFFTHRENIKRLLKGEEEKISLFG